MRERIEGFPDYEITDQGKIYSYRESVQGKLMKPTLTKNRALQVRLINSHGKRLSREVHRLMAMTFIPNPDNLPCVSPIDGNPSNISLDNLEWRSKNDTLNKSYREGKRNNPLSFSKVEEIKNLLIRGATCAELGRAYEVSRSSISDIKNNRSWTDVPWPILQ